MGSACRLNQVARQMGVTRAVESSRKKVCYKPISVNLTHQASARIIKISTGNGILSDIREVLSYRKGCAALYGRPFPLATMDRAY